MVLTPWDADQPGVAARAEALGVAAIVPRDEVTAESLAAAVNAVLDHDQYAVRAAELAEQFAQRSPEDAASALIEDL